MCISKFVIQQLLSIISNNVYLNVTFVIIKLTLYHNNLLFYSLRFSLDVVYLKRIFTKEEYSLIILILSKFLNILKMITNIENFQVRLSI